MSPSSPLPTSMPAWQFNSASPTMHANLKLNQTAPVPPLGKESTLIKVLSSALNPVDHKVAEVPWIGKYAVGGYPSTPCMDFTGRVWKTTLTDPGFKEGDLVFGALGAPETFGTLAGFIVVKGRENLARVPDGFDPDMLDGLATVGVAGLTALQSLAGLKEGDNVFINGGSGGVGTYSLQIAKNVFKCANVVTSCSGANADLVKGLGATEVIDYRSKDVLTALKEWTKKTGQKFDLVVDHIGSAKLYWAAADYMKEGAEFRSLGGELSVSGIADTAKMFLWPAFLGGGKRKFTMTFCKANRIDFDKMSEYMKTGQVKAVIDTTYEMQDAVKAFEKLKTGRTRGKIVVRVSDDGR